MFSYKSMTPPWASSVITDVQGVCFEVLPKVGWEETGSGSNPDAANEPIFFCGGFF